MLFVEKFQPIESLEGNVMRKKSEFACLTRSERDNPYLIYLKGQYLNDTLCTFDRLWKFKLSEHVAKATMDLRCRVLNSHSIFLSLHHLQAHDEYENSTSLYYCTVPPEMFKTIYSTIKVGTNNTQGWIIVDRLLDLSTMNCFSLTTHLYELIASNCGKTRNGKKRKVAQPNFSSLLKCKHIQPCDIWHDLLQYLDAIQATPITLVIFAEVQQMNMELISHMQKVFSTCLDSNGLRAVNAIWIVNSHGRNPMMLSELETETLVSTQIEEVTTGPIDVFVQQIITELCTNPFVSTSCELLKLVDIYLSFERDRCLETVYRSICLWLIEGFGKSTHSFLRIPLPPVTSSTLSKQKGFKGILMDKLCEVPVEYVDHYSSFMVDVVEHYKSIASFLTMWSTYFALRMTFSILVKFIYEVMRLDPSSPPSYPFEKLMSLIEDLAEGNVSSISMQVERGIQILEQDKENLATDYRKNFDSCHTNYRVAPEETASKCFLGDYVRRLFPDDAHHISWLARDTTMIVKEVTNKLLDYRNCFQQSRFRAIFGCFVVDIRDDPLEEVLLYALPRKHSSDINLQYDHLNLILEAVGRFEKTFDLWSLFLEFCSNKAEGTRWCCVRCAEVRFLLGVETLVHCCAITKPIASNGSTAAETSDNRDNDALQLVKGRLSKYRCRRLVMLPQ